MSLMSTTLFRTLVVQPWQVALERYRGEPTVVLGPGRHRRRRRASYVHLDLRQQVGGLAVQELPTSDGLSVKVSVGHTWHVGDPVTFAERSTDPLAVTYLAVQVGLREVLAGRTAEEIVGEPRAELGARVLAVAGPRAGEVGVVIDEVVVKDVMLPPELRAAASELAVGRHRAQVQLEAARAQTAALRSLANGAKLLEEHPALARQRLVESLPYGAEVKIVLPTD